MFINLFFINIVAELNSNEEARQAVIRELVATEVDHIKHLQAIVDVRIDNNNIINWCVKYAALYKIAFINFLCEVNTNEFTSTFYFRATTAHNERGCWTEYPVQYMYMEFILRLADIRDFVCVMYYISKIFGKIKHPGTRSA